MAAAPASPGPRPGSRSRRPGAGAVHQAVEGVADPGLHIAGAWVVTRAGTRTAESSTPRQRVSRSGTIVSNMTPPDPRPRTPPPWTAPAAPRRCRSRRPPGARAAAARRPRRRHRAPAQDPVPQRVHDESASQPPGQQTASREATSGRPTWLNTKLPTTTSNAPSPAGIASNDPTRNGIDGWASAARRTIEDGASNPHRVRPERSGGGGKIPAAADVEDLVGPFRARRTAGPDDPAGQRAQERVGVRARLPARGLEGVERLGMDRAAPIDLPRTGVAPGPPPPRG